MSHPHKTRTAFTLHYNSLAHRGRSHDGQYRGTVGGISPMTLGSVVPGRVVCVERQVRVSTEYVGSDETTSTHPTPCYIADQGDGDGDGDETNFRLWCHTLATFVSDNR